MRVATIVVLMLVLTTPSESSQSCMTETEARQHFGSVHIYWHRKDHCWDATPTRQHQLIDKVQQEIDEPKWYDAMSQILLEEEPGQTPWVDRWVEIEPPQLPIVEIVQIAPPPIIECEPAPMVTPRGMEMVIITMVLTLAVVDVFNSIIYVRLAPRRNTRSAVFSKKTLFRSCAAF